MIISEIGLNHLGNFYQAKSMVKKLVATNVEGITLQIRENDYYLNKQHFRLSDDEYIEIVNYVKQHNKCIGIAIADESKIDFLESIGIDFYKVIRNDITNDSLLKKLISTNKKIIVSTGLSSDEDIEKFINEFGTKNITLNHTQLSHDPEDCNLLAIQNMKEKYNCNISFGSHCDNVNVLYMSLCYNPSDILFYVKGSGTLRYPDDKHAIPLKMVHGVINNLINLQEAIGSGSKEKMEIKI